MNITHISAECYPVAKVGGLADVVGALPKYQNSAQISSQVIMPFYDNTFTQNNTFDYVYSADDTERFLAFQIGALNWMLTWEKYPDIIHCHDHHTGLIPFMLQESFQYEAFRKIPNILTIHNAQYQGWFSHEKVHLIPSFNFNHVGLLDWGGNINPLAAAIKCAWRVTTVSPSYMEELKTNANGLENLLSAESHKCFGILNGIDWNVWNPKTDDYITKNYTIRTVESGANANKKYLCDTFNLDFNKPLFFY